MVSGRGDVDQLLGISIEQLNKQVPSGTFRTGMTFTICSGSNQAMAPL